MGNTAEIELVTRAVVKVGDGRGFIVEGRRRHRYVITAAHCLPEFPPPNSFSYTEERTYAGLVATLDGEKPTVTVELVFADPIGDIAVLCSPDSQELFEEADAYEALVDDVEPIVVSALADETDVEARLLSLDQRWITCKARARPNGMIHLTACADGIRGGMSGSPILVDGKAVGVVTASGGSGDGLHTEGFEARLTRNLPGWLLHDLGL